MKLFAIAALCATFAAPFAAAGQITPIADAQRGTMVTVQGMVERIMPAAISASMSAPIGCPPRLGKRSSSMASWTMT